MKRAEKTRITYEKILNAAIAEFGNKSYDSASINNICSDNNISKGLIYHNFKNKDDLYLSVVKVCFEEITSFLNSANYTNDDFRENIKKLLDLRVQFFYENPNYSNIFFNAVLQPPKHLATQIKELKSDFDEFNFTQYKKIIATVTLRDGITINEAVEYFFAFQEMFNGYFSSKASASTDLGTLIKEHETKLSKILNIMLYGIAKKEADYNGINS